MTETKKISDAYFEKPKWTKTWSRIPVKGVYGSEDVAALDYEKDLNEPGEYPYTRGIFPGMYRGRLWTRREVSGHSSPSASNKRLKYLMGQGVTGLNIIGDLPTQLMIDSDHPFAKNEVGVQGTPIVTVHDMMLLTRGIPLDEVSFTFSAMTPVMAFYVAAGKKRGISPEKLRGTIINDTIHYRYCYGNKLPLDLGVRLAVDSIGYAIDSMPLWYPFSVECYDLREHGIDAVQELALGFAIAFCLIDECLKRGYEVDDIASKIAFTMGVHIDIFEEAAKFRAARRMWARTLREKYGATLPKALHFKFHANTNGSMTVRQQPLNNIIRVAYSALAAVLGGTQSMQTVSYDEPIALPTEESARIAVRTQQILAYETGVTRVADPLGGSYYVESLTDTIEDEVQHFLGKIDEVGGLLKAIESEWLGNEIAQAAYQYQKEVESGERIIVGRNAFVIPEKQEREAKVHRRSERAAKKHMKNLKEIREKRDTKKLGKAIDNLYRKTENREENLLPAMVEAATAKATIGEIMGTIRQAYGYSYDPFDTLASPF
jgi:methylmalonyl-CoA mutase N-terminal domain/subunit